MATDGPRELRFDFIADDPAPKESDRPVDGEQPEKLKSATEKAKAPAKKTKAALDDPKITALRPTSSETSEEEDHAAELKRRVAELRNASRRSKTTSRPASVRPPAEVVHLEQPTVEREFEVAQSHQEVVIDDRLGDPFADPFADAPSGSFDEPQEELDIFDDALTIASFYERVRRALAQEFSEEIWVSGEIRGFRESRGHRYLELADKGVEVVGRGVAQQLEVVCWARDWPPIARALSEAGVDLEVGRVVRVRGKVSVWEGGSKLRFTLTALDVEALIGGIAAARRRLLAALAEEDLLEANRRLGLSLVPLRIGIVTSPGSEAHRDFVGQLERSGFAFEIHLEPSLVQGSEAPTQIAAALGRMAAFAPELVAVIRGGGARGDLAAFDDELVARSIATAPFPVWTGIGHTSDRSVADEVAQRSLITPTACGEAVVEVVDLYWGGAIRRIETASRLARNHLENAHRHISTSASSLVKSVRHQLGRRSDGLLVANSSLSRSVDARLSSEFLGVTRRAVALQAGGQRALSSAESNLVRDRRILNAFDPTRQLERGWALVHDADGHLVRSVETLGKGDHLRTRFLGGYADSVVESIDREPTSEIATGQQQDNE